MSRAALSLWTYLWRVLLFALLALGPPFSVVGVWDSPVPPFLVCFPLSLVYFTVVVGWQWRWLWRLVRHTAGFRTWRGPQAVIHYAAELRGCWNFEVLAEQCEAELDDLTRRFGFPLRRPVVVYLFANHRTIAAIFGKPYAGTALRFANAVLVANDCPVRECVRHEMVHLFAARWAVQPPALLQEGLATWLQETWGGKPIDRIACWLISTPKKLPLSALLNRKLFFSDVHRAVCYMLAGSFTGFLIHRLGWEGYRRLYRTAHRTGFRAALKKCSGLTLESAEEMWRNELIATTMLRFRLERELSS